MKHLGDITKIKGNEVPIVDIITGGSPCQDLSCAGLRKGMQHSALGDEETTRSGLFMEQIRITKEMRDECVRQLQMRGADVDIRHIRPRYLVWENVPGAFSSNKGEDFRCVLEEVARITDKDAVIPGPPQGKWTPSGAIMLESGGSIAWRVHDAQFWGVPQRRKRISLVADFGGTSAPEILFERKGLSGDSEQSGEERKETSGTIERDSDPSSFTLKIRGGVEIDSKGKRTGKGALIQTELSGTLGVSQDQTLITGCNNQTEVYGICSDNSNSMKSSNPYSGIYKADTTRTLDLNGGNPACNQGGMMVLEPISFQGQAGAEASLQIGKNVSSTLSCTKQAMVAQSLNTVEQHAVFSIDEKMGQTYIGDDVGNTLAQRDYKQPQAVCYGVDSYNQTTEEEVIGALRTNGGGDNSPKVCYGVDCYNQSQSEEVSKTLNVSATDSDHIPCVYGLDRASFNQGKNAKYDFSVEEETAQTLVSRGPGGVLAKQ